MSTLRAAHAGVNTAGRPLDAGTRAFMETRFGHDFSRVRVHTDAVAATSARAMNARAYTVGHDVVFAAGRYEPHTTGGRRLLAHELTHVAQQRRAGPTSPVNRYGDHPSPLERQADVVAERVASGRQAGPVGEATGRCVQAQHDEGVADPEEQTVPAAVGKQALERDPAHVRKTGGGADEATGKKVCFTFDDGPQPGTGDVLDVLAAKGIPATFFLTGDNMKGDPEQKVLVERMLSEGHQIGNHTFTHAPMNEAGYKKAYGDLSDPAKLKKFQENFERNQQYFTTLLGAASPVFALARLPGQGRFISVGGKLIFVVATGGMGMAHVTWHFELGPNGSFGTLKARDWKGVKGVASERDALPKSNDIMLMHDRHWAGKQALLTAVVTKLTSNGFTFGQLDAAGKCG